MRGPVDLHQSITGEVVVPTDPANCFNQAIHEVDSRNWFVPGETLLFFLRTAPSSLQLDSMLFSHRFVHQHVPTRRETVSLGTSMPRASKALPLSSSISHQSFKSREPFRLPTGEGIYPMSAKIPQSLTSPVVLEVHLAGQKTPIASLPLRPLLPFETELEIRSTSVSLVAIFKITTSLKHSGLHSVDVNSTSLFFKSTPPNDGQDFERHIDVIDSAPLAHSVMADCNKRTSVFVLRPLTELGAVIMANNRINFSVHWSCGFLKFTNIYSSEIKSECIGFAFLTSSVTAELMKKVIVTMKITNLHPEKKKVDLVFEGGPVQPTTQRIHVPELDRGASTTIAIAILPLAVGDHKLVFWAEEGGRRVDPLFPTYISVVKSLNQSTA
jgi:hypothetical protein